MRKYNIISGVYIIRNLVNSDTYIGSSVNVNHRWSQHITLLNRNIHWVKPLQTLFNERGRSYVYLEILQVVKGKNKLKDREQYWLDTLSPSYNVCKNSRNTEGRRFSEETKKKISIANKGNRYALGRKHKEETKIKIGLASKGRTSYWKGKKLPPETIEKLMKSRKGCFGTFKGKKHLQSSKEKIKSKKKKILLNTQNGIFYYGVKEAAASIGANEKSLYNKLCGFRRNNTSLIYA